MGLCRLEELGWEGLKAFVADQEPGKMFHILNYIFLGHALQKGVKQEWLDILDIDYIDVRDAAICCILAECPLASDHALTSITPERHLERSSAPPS
jgi:hypothetical protein